MSITTSDNRKDALMLTSNGFNIAMFAKPLAVVAAIAAAGIMSPAFAQSSHGRDAARADRQSVRQIDEYAPSRGGRDAYAAARGSSMQLDPNSPEATGGGSLGYNQHLLID
jgi:hypothetical protein